MNLLKKDKRLWDKDILNKPLLFELLEKYDSELFKLLLSDKETKAKYFVQAGESYVFKYEDFRFSIEQTNLGGSYTKYKNTIGLSNKGKFLIESTDYVLDWPYKDTILEGGMGSEEEVDTFIEKTTETTSGKIDGKTGTVISNEKKEVTFSKVPRKKNEIFYNSIIAKEEIDRLLEKKALKNFTRYTAKGEEEVKDIKRDEDGTIKENLLIKGNNLLALYSLKEQFAGKVKLIYIDPPYNTGNDGFVYNDRFNHSTWLTFMKNRLEVAREFLREDGIIFVQCDDNEQAYLKVLMDQIFGRANFIGDLIRKTKSSTNDAKVGFNIQHENTLIYAKSKEKAKLKGEEKDLSNYSNPDNDPKGDWVSSDPSASRTNTIYPIKNPYTGQVDYPPKGRSWSFSEKRLKEFIKSGKIVFKKEEKQNQRGFIFKRYKSELRDMNKLLNSLDASTNEFMNQVATKEKNAYTDLEFSYSKPEKFIQLIIQSGSEEDDIVMDFHLGSGTTAAVAHKLNRQYIGIEQIDYIETIATQRLLGEIKGQVVGISKDIDWKGGGDFIYLELAEYNEEAINKIDSCKTYKELKKLFTNLSEYYFLNYNVSVKQFNEQILDDKDFQELSLEEQKIIFKALLDNNQLYISYNEQDYTRFKLSKEDRELTKMFYE